MVDVVDEDEFGRAPAKCVRDHVQQYAIGAAFQGRKPEEAGKLAHQGLRRALRGDCDVDDGKVSFRRSWVARVAAAELVLFPDLHEGCRFALPGRAGENHAKLPYLAVLVRHDPLPRRALHSVVLRRLHERACLRVARPGVVLDGAVTERQLA